MGNDYDVPPTIYSLLNSYVNFSREVPVKISDLAKTGRSMFFDFEYPLAEGISKEDFETMILNHFLMRRIGYETVTAFKIALNVKLNEIMPLYNKLFISLENWNLFTDGEIVTRITNDNGLSTTVNSTTTNNKSDRRYSDTPQNEIADVQDGKYVTEYNYDQDNGTANASTNQLNTNNTAETITRTPGDKMQLYSEFLKNRQNIYTMIFKDLDTLFYQII